MYFYVDESGNTGKNLFDPAQPSLYYGVLSSKVNLDILALPYLQNLRKRLKVERLHAVDLSNEKLALIVPEILSIHKKYGLTFDFYRIAKADHALICFFDQVFDQEVNPAVSWHTYWTPLRYAMLLKLACLFDDDALKKAWAARIELDAEKAQSQLVELCQTIKDRVHFLPDERSRELITDALQWAQDHPDQIHYNAASKEDIAQIIPNLIGFQFVMFGIASRIVKNKNRVSNITVDQQAEFNKAQQTLQDFYLKFPRNFKTEMGPGLPDFNLKGLATTPISFSPSLESAGLELVDIFLWAFKRHFEGKELPQELLSLLRSKVHRGNRDEVSLQALSERWGKWFQQKREISEEDMKVAKEIMDMHEQQRLKAINKK